MPTTQTLPISPTKIHLPVTGTNPFKKLYQSPMQTSAFETMPIADFQPGSILQAVLEGLIDGILILTEKGELIHANEWAKKICDRLVQGAAKLPFIPTEIWQICESLIESRELFSNQKMVLESEITKAEGIDFRVRVRWLKLEQHQHSCILVTLEDRFQALQETVTTDAYKYSFTPREAEVWFLYRSHYSYKEIADELYITLNTVKKHMKNIHAKRKAAGIEDEDNDNS